MKIDDISQNISQIGNLDTTPKRRNEEETSAIKEAEKTPRSGAKVDLSNTSVEFSRAAEMMDKVPEKRTEKIEKLTAQVRNDTYDVEADKIAEGIITDTITNIVGPE